jgi:hypothetical protein
MNFPKHNFLNRLEHRMRSVFECMYHPLRYLLKPMFVNKVGVTGRIRKDLLIIELDVINFSNQLFHYVILSKYSPLLEMHDFSPECVTVR